jgi:uncharacterized alkaline shock family protein YloU
MSRDGHVVEGPLGRIELTGAALAGLVVDAAELVPGARVRRPRRGLDISVAEGRARVSLELAVAYGTVLPELARSTQEHVASALRTTAGLEIDAVDVSIEELDG